jgi:hypothetical protein
MCLATIRFTHPPSSLPRLRSHHTALGSPSINYAVNTSPGTMSSTVISSSNFQFIFDAALADYLDQTGVDLTKDSFTEKLRKCRTADDVLELLQDKVNQFREYRNGNRKLINCLKPVVQVLHAFSGVLGGVARLVSASSSSI